MDTNICDLSKDDWVVFKLPKNVSKEAKKRRYFVVENGRLLKQIKAVNSDYVLINMDEIKINSMRLENSSQLLEDNMKRKMPLFSMNRELVSGELIVMGQSKDSFDSRYFGVINKAWVKSKAKPLFVRQ